MNRTRAIFGKSIPLAMLWICCGCCSEESSVMRVTAEELQARLTAGEAVVVDVRTDYEYRLGHIQGAVHIPLSQIAARAEELPRDKLIATYCS